MKKKKIYNVGMVVIILLIVFCGLAVVGVTKGWLKEDARFYASQKTGIVVVERNGLAYEVQESSVIKSGDILHTNTSSELEISDGKEKEPRVWLNGNTDFFIAEEEEKLVFEVLGGEAFADVKDWKNAAVFISGDMEIDASQSVISVSMHRGSSMVCVYSGKVDVTIDDTKKTVKSGQVMSVAENTKEKKAVTVNDLQADALNDFQMTKLLELNPNGSFCFAEADLREIKQIREKERIEAQQAKLLEKNTKTAGEKNSVKAPEKEKTELDRDDKSNAEDVSEGTEFSGSQKGDTEEENKSKQDNKIEDSTVEEKPQAESEPETEEEPPAETEVSSEETESQIPGQEESTQESAAQYCTIEIRCDTILNNMENLASGKDVYVPADGTLLAVSKVEFTAGETVFDVLKRACELVGMPLEYSYTPMYESYYVEGINQLYEFDCGSQSGWMYKVNGWFPNYGCSAYQIQKDDAVVFCYTCTGLGTDVGGSNY